MNFTKQDLQKLLLLLTRLSKKDSEFEPTDTITSDTQIPILQEGKNKRIPFDRVKDAVADSLINIDGNVVPIDQNISPVSSNPVENKAIYNKFNEINTRIDGIDAELDNVVHKSDSTYTTLQSTVQEHSTAIEGKASLNSETGRLEPKQGPVMILKSIDGFNGRGEGYSEENLEEGEYCSSFVRIQSLHANIKTRKNGNIVTVGKPDTETLYYNLDDESLYHYTGLNSWSKIKTASSTPLPISIELGLDGRIKSSKSACMVLDYIEAVNGSVTITKRAGCTYCVKAQSTDVAGSFDDIVKYVVGVDSNNNPVEASLGKPDEKIIYYNKYNNKFYIYQDGYLNPFVEVGLQTTDSLVEGDSSKALSGNGARDLFLRTTTLITDMDWDGGSDNIIAQGSLLYNKTSKRLFYFHSKYLPSTYPQSGSQSDSQSGSQSGVVPVVQPIHVPASSNMNQKYIAFTPDPGLLYTDTNGNQYRWNQLSNSWLLISNSNGIQTISVNGGNQTGPDQYGNVNLTITGIKGDKGDKGDPGTNGTQGPKGDTGQKGKDGLTPQINDEGYWVFVDDNGEHSTGVKAAGTKITIDREGYWCIDGIRTDYLASGSVGNMPVIDKNIKVLSVKELEQNYNVYANETISGLLRKPIQKGSDGHYTYEQYEQMKNNAEGITRAISDAYSQGYIGVIFPKQHYLLCSVVYEGGTDAGLTNDLIWILNIANFLVDFNNSTIQLCVDTTADWVITDGPSQEEYTNKIDNARLNDINNGNIRCTFKLERRCKNKNNDTVHGLAIINRSIALQSPYSDPNDATSTRDDESGYQSTLAEAIKYAQRHCNGTIITIKQCHHVTVQNVKLLGDCYTRTYSDDLDHRKLEAKIEDSTGLNVSGFVTDHITIKNVDASGFTADGLSTGSKSPFYYARPLTADQRRLIVNGANRDGYEALTGNSYFTVTGLLGNTVYYTRRYPSENSVNGTTNVEPLGGTIEVKSSSSDKKRRAIGRIYNRPADKLLTGNYNELVKEQLSKLLFSIESPGGNTRRTRCYPSVEIITYKKFDSEDTFREFVGIDSSTETLAWFQEPGQNCGRYANESIYSTTYYRHVNSSAYGDILVEYNKITDSNGTTNKDITGYYIAGRIIECEFKESFHLYPDEKYFRIQTLYEQLGEDNLDLYLDGEGQTKKRVPYLSIWTPPCSDVIIDSCYFHDNLRGHCALGSNNTSIFRSVFDKFASCNIYINNIMGMYPRRYGTTDYSIDIEDSFANKLVIEDCVFKAFPGRDVKPLGDLMFPGLLRLIFNRNLCYNCMPYGSGLYEATITNNVFYHTAVFFDNATPAEDRFGKDVWRNVVFQNNTYYDARIHSIVTKNRNNRIRVVDCYIDIREEHPESDVIINKNYNNEIFNDNYDNGDVEFINCTLNLADNGNANAFLGTLINCKINGGKGWRAKSIDGGEINNTYISFFPTNRNCVSKGGKLYISVEAKGVKGMTLATNIYEEYWFNSLTTAENNAYNSFVIDLYFKDCEMQLINKYFEYGVGPGKRIQGASDYQRTSIENITYHFDNCRFIRENYNIDEEYPLLSNSNNVTMIFNNCDFSAAYAQYEYNAGGQAVTKQCLAYKGIKDSGGNTYTSGILTTVFNNCIIPENTYFDTSSDTVITNNSQNGNKEETEETEEA